VILAPLQYNVVYLIQKSDRRHQV